MKAEYSPWPCNCNNAMLLLPKGRLRQNAPLLQRSQVAMSTHLSKNANENCSEVCSCRLEKCNVNVMNHVESDGGKRSGFFLFCSVFQ